MGRRKQKQLAFVQGNSLAEELEASSSDDDEPGGLHIGGIVVRAPARSRAAEHLGRKPSRAPAAAPVSSSRAAGMRNHPQQLQQEELERLFASEDSLDDELRDYLDNVKQHDDDSGEALEPDGAAAAAAPAATQQGSRRHAAAADVDSSGSEDWEELGSRPGLGFAGAAAARFAAVSLDEALEGALGSDMRRDSNNSFDSDASSSSSSDYSDSGSSSDEDAPEQLDLSSLDASTAVVVDAQGRPMAVWESLTLQQRFPVQARAGDAGTGAGSSRRRRQQQGRQAPSRSSSGRTGAAGMLPADLPADSPAFECEVTAAAAKAAYAAALAAADVDAVQRQQCRQQQKSLAKGARHGQLLPGEKKRLRKEKIAAKRCERHGQQGQGALALLAAVERFALGGGDMEVLPPCGKHKQAFVRCVATLYGVRASAQGGSSSGRTALLLASTPDTGKPAADAAAQLQVLLTAELTREITAAAIAAGPGERPAAATAGSAGQQGGSSRQRR
ncbi:hypothetical protein OEZ86_011077 [Tetradesmus obliquus]|nr:hypothetical protein OEZ86_011077 [Tetradesmus obliquus]